MRRAKLRFDFEVLELLSVTNQGSIATEGRLGEGESGNPLLTSLLIKDLQLAAGGE
jgi:hypothetical protein